MNIELTDMPEARELNIISKGIQNYNTSFLPEAVVYEKDTKFAVFVRDESNNIVGGIRAKAFWNYCFIELLWLSGKVRKRGIGSKLLLKAEKHAKGLGFEFMRTETTSFQAMPFYEKNGYKVIGELKDYPKGHTMYCLVKQL